jgi:archaellum component FlaC
MSVKKTIEFEAKVDKAEKDLQGVAKSVQRIDNNLAEVKETTGGVAKGVKGISNALKAAGIG